MNLFDVWISIVEEEDMGPNCGRAGVAPTMTGAGRFAHGLERLCEVEEILTVLFGPADTIALAGEEPVRCMADVMIEVSLSADCQACRIRLTCAGTDTTILGLSRALLDALENSSLADRKFVLVNGVRQPFCEELASVGVIEYH